MSRRLYPHETGVSSASTTRLRLVRKCDDQYLVSIWPRESTMKGHNTVNGEWPACAASDPRQPSMAAQRCFESACYSPIVRSLTAERLRLNNNDPAVTDAPSARFIIRARGHRHDNRCRG